MSLRTQLPEPFLAKLNSSLWEHVLEMFLRSQTERPQGGAALEFYNRWKDCYELSPLIMDSFLDELVESIPLQDVIDRHALMPEGKKNFLRSPKHRQQYLAFALAIHYQAWKTNRPAAELYTEYLATMDTKMRIQTLKNQVKQEQAISAQLRVENAQLRAQIAQIGARNGLLEHREPVVIKTTVVRRRALKRKQPE